MLVVTRCLHEAICLGDAMRVTVRRRHDNHVMVEVVVPIGTRVCHAGVPARLIAQDGDELRYSAALLLGDSLQVGDATVWIGSRYRPDKHRKRMRIGIEAPRSMPVHREEVFLRNQRALRADTLLVAR